jgi:hypothetical protein
MWRSAALSHGKEACVRVTGAWQRSGFRSMLAKFTKRIGKNDDKSMGACFTAQGVRAFECPAGFGRRPRKTKPVRKPRAETAFPAKQQNGKTNTSKNARQINDPPLTPRSGSRRPPWSGAARRRPAPRRRSGRRRRSRARRRAPRDPRSRSAHWSDRGPTSRRRRTTP